MWNCFRFSWIPESIDWLLAEGKHQKAVEIIEWAERVNKVTVPIDAKSEVSYKTSESESTKKYVNCNVFTIHISPYRDVRHHLLLDRSSNIGPLVSRWELDKFENC
jgi:hypothetical protein